MKSVKAYLFSSEQKDKYCLSPIHNGLADYFESVASLSFDNICDEMAEFSVAECPVAVFSSISAYDFAKFIRGGRPFISIGLEHGVAPFKGYTYNSRFLEYDCYISPTRMWADRLARLHPRYAKKFAHIAYPRIDDLSDLAKQPWPVHSAWGKAPAAQRDLVILSWGVNFSTLRRLPDREGVVYLVHPSMWKAAARTKLSHARIVVSEPDVAASLVSQASRIFGDFSSMTLEAALLNNQTFMFVDRRFYGSDCDLAPEFFDRAHDGFGSVQHTGFALPKKYVLDLQGVCDALGGQYPEPEAAVASWAPSGMLPELSGDQGARAAAVIASVVKGLWEEKRELACMSPNLLAMKVVDAAYREVLGRQPDYPAALAHARNWLASDAPRPAKTLSLYNTFAQSAEGKRRWEAGNFNLPELKLELMAGDAVKASQ